MERTCADEKHPRRTFVHLNVERIPPRQPIREVKRLVSEVIVQMDVDGSLIETWTSLKSFRPKEEPPEDKGLRAATAGRTSNGKSVAMKFIRARAMWRRGCCAKGWGGNPRAAWIVTAGAWR